MKSTIFIPKVINVGYQNRKDTYTGKLADVVYTDEKGVVRKQASWDGWRDNNIEPDTFDNIPTSGFVLNKKVGDTCSHWNFRQAYCRVYDPRGFEFEITIENLLYILENTNSIVGKGLEGEFVYGWSGKDLILLPTNSPDYKDIMDYTNAICSDIKITAKSLVVGATYLGKDGYNYIYLGKHMTYSYPDKWYDEEQEEQCKEFYFWQIDPNENPYPFNVNIGEWDVDTSSWSNVSYGKNTGSFITRKSISNKFLIDTIDTEPSIHMNAIMDVLNHNSTFCPINVNATIIKPETETNFINRIMKIYKQRTELGYDIAADWAYITFFTKDNGSIQNYVIGTNYHIDKVINVYKATVNSQPWCDRLDVYTQDNYIVYTIGEKLTEDKLKEIYNKYHPYYCDIYLKNGVHYNRIYMCKGE